MFNRFKGKFSLIISLLINSIVMAMPSSIVYLTTVVTSIHLIQPPSVVDCLRAFEENYQS